MKLIIEKKQKRVRTGPPLAKYKLDELKAVISRTNILKARIKRMRFQSLGPKRDFVNIKVRYGTTIERGQPTCFAMDGTEDGLKVVLPSSVGAGAHSLFAGVALKTGAVNSIQETQVYGFCEAVTILRTTRAASTASWASAASIASMAILVVHGGYNIFDTIAAAAATAPSPDMILLENIAAFTGAASATTDTRTLYTTSAKAFLRFM